jgi:hypothetical protein
MFGLGELDGAGDCATACAAIFDAVLAACELSTALETLGVSTIACWAIAIAAEAACLDECAG